MADQNKDIIKQTSVETESGKMGRSNSDHGSALQTRAKMEFGNEMQATFQIAVDGSREGFNRLSQGSGDLGAQPQNFGNQPNPAASPTAKGFQSAAARGYERTKLPQSKSQLSKKVGGLDPALGILEENNKEPESPGIKHSVLVKHASKPNDLAKRAHSGFEMRGKPDLTDEGSPTMVSIGGVRATGTLEARDRQSQPPQTNAEYASDGHMRSTMYITNALGGQNYLGYPHNEQPGQYVINVGTQPTHTEGFMQGKMSVEGQGVHHRVLNNQVIGGGQVSAGVQGSFKPKIKPKVSPQMYNAGPGPRPLRQRDGSTSVQSNQDLSHLASPLSVDARAELFAVDDAAVTNPSSQLTQAMPAVLNFSPEHARDPKLIISAIGKISAKHSQLKLKDMSNGSRLNEAPSPTNVMYQRIHISNIPVTTVDPRAMIPSQPAPAGEALRNSQGLNQTHLSRPQLGARREHKNKSASRSPADKRRRQPTNIKDFHHQQQRQYEQYLRKADDQSKGLGHPQNKDHQNSQSTLMYHQTDDMASLGSKPDTKTQRDAHAQIAQSAESSLLDAVARMDSGHRGPPPPRQPSMGQRVANAETVERQIGLASGAQEITSPAWHQPASPSPTQHGLQNADLRQLREAERTHRQTKKTVLQTIGASGGSDGEASGQDPYARTHMGQGQFGTERLNSKYLSTLREGNQKLNIIMNPVLGHAPSDISAGGRKKSVAALPEDMFPSEFNTEPHTLAGTKKALTGYEKDPRMMGMHVIRDSHEGEKHGSAYSQGTQHMYDGVDPGSSQASAHGHGGPFRYGEDDQPGTIKSVSSGRARGILEQSSPMNRIQSYRQLLKDEQEQNRHFMNQNQESFKNLISPDVTKNKYTIMNNSPSQKAFYFGISQNSQAIKVREQNQLTTVTNAFLQENLQPAKPIFRQETLDTEELKRDLLRKIARMRSIEAHERGQEETQESHNTQEFSQLPVDTRDADAHKRKLTGVKIPIQKQILMQQHQQHDNELFLTYLNQEGRQPLGGGPTSPLDTALTGGSFVQPASDHWNMHHTSPFSEQKGAFASPGTVLKAMQQTRFEMTELSQGTGPGTAGAHSDVEKVMVRVHPDDQGGVGQTSPIDRSAFRSITNKRERSDRSPSNSANTIGRIAQRYDRDQLISIYEDGKELSQNSPCIQLELNALLKKYYVRQKGESDQTTAAEDIKAQIQLYENAVQEVLDECSWGLCLPSDLSAVAQAKLGGGPPRSYTHLFTLYGERITSVIEIDQDVQFLVAGTSGKFKGLKTNELFCNDETSKSILNRMVKESPVKIDQSSGFANRTASNVHSHEDLSSPQRSVKAKDEGDALTFKLTSLSHAMATPQKGRTPRQAALSSKQIREASRKELKAASRNAALDALIRAKHRKAQSYSSIQANSGLRRQKLEMLAKITSGIKRGKLPPLKSPRQLDDFVFGVPEKEETGAIGNQSPRYATLDQLGLDTDSSFNMMMTAKLASVSNTMREEREHLSTSSLMTGKGGQKSPFQKFENTARASSKSGATASALLLKEKLNSQQAQQIHQDGRAPGRGGAKPKQQLDDKTIQLAKVALRERSPSYMGDKLVSQVGLQSETFDFKQEDRSRVEEAEVKAEMNMHVLQNTLTQRTEWRNQYKLNDKELFEVFSEFSAMMVLHRQRINEAKPDSMKNRLAAQTISKDYLSEIFPVQTSSRKYNQLKREEAHLQHKLKKKDLADFRVPAWICMEYSEVLKSTKAKLRPTVMRALGIWSEHKGDKMTYEQFLNMSSLLKYKRQTKEDLVDFAVRLFDPSLGGFTPNSKFEAMLDAMFEVEDGDGKEPAKKEAPKKKVEIKTPQEEEEEQEDKMSEAKTPKPSKAASKASKKGDEEEGDSADSDEEGDREAAPEERKVLEQSESEIMRGVMEELQGESVANSMKRKCREKRIMREDGFLDPHALAQAFQDGTLELEEFTDALS